MRHTTHQTIHDTQHKTQLETQKSPTAKRALSAQELNNLFQVWRHTRHERTRETKRDLAAYAM